MKVASEFFAISDRKSRQHQTSTFRQKKSDGFGIHFVFKSLLTTPSNVLPLHLKQTFQLIIWIFTEVEGGEIKSRLHFKIFSTLCDCRRDLPNLCRFVALNCWSYCLIRLQVDYEVAQLFRCDHWKRTHHCQYKVCHNVVSYAWW